MRCLATVVLAASTLLAARRTKGSRRVVPGCVTTTLSRILSYPGTAALTEISHRPGGSPSTE